MASELIASLGIFKALYDSAKALKDMNDAAVRNGAVIELQEKILAAREAQTTCLDRIRELEEKVTSFETWNAEKERYELKALRSSVFAYMLKARERGTKPPHWVCINCYNNGKISPFQWTAHSAQGHRVFQCSDPRCKAEIAPGSEPRWMD